MKKLILLIFFLICSYLSNSQDIIDRLYHTCKVWGYLKYHHTNITKGYVDWDSTLLISLDGIKSAPDKAAFQDSLNQLLYRAGALQEYIDYWATRGDSIKLNKDFSWFNDPYLSKNVQDTLFKIKSIFKNEAIYYLSTSIRPPISHFIFDNKYFNEELYPEENKRILAVFRYWNLIEYFYHHKSNLNVSWNIRLKEFIKEILAVQTKEEYALTFRKITKTIEDSEGKYSQPIYDSIVGNAFCPFKVRLIENKTIITEKLSAASELEIGDEIIELDNEPIEQRRSYYRSLVEGSNPAAIERNVDEYILKGPQDKFSMKYVKKDKSINLFESRREPVYYDSLFAQKIEDKPWIDTILSEGCKFGIIKINKYNPGNRFLEMLEVIWDNDAWIFDLRGNANVDFSKFVPYIYQDTIRYLFWFSPNFQIPGEFFFNRNSSPIYNKPIFEKNIILLVDEYTRSLSESFGLSFQMRKNVFIIGSMTDGSNWNSIATILLPGKIKTKLSTTTSVDKNRNSLHGIGVKPNYIVKPTIEGIRAGRDEVMEFALKCEYASPKTSGILSIDNEFKIYPNPVVDILSIEMNKKSRFNSIQIFNLIGQKIIEKEYLTNEVKLDLSNFEKGIYILKINGDKSYKIVKE